MLNLENHITLDERAIRSPNLCDQFSDADLTNIGIYCHDGYLKDEKSRDRWLKRNEAGMDLALQIQKDKTFPWPGCANVAFPLVTIAAMQFHARAYPAIVGTGNLVKCEVFGDDPTGAKTARATRVGNHMSWQLRYEDRAWEEQEDKMLLNLSIVGTNFKKTYRDVGAGCNISELVLAKDLVLNYWSKSVETAPRKTHLIPKYRNEVREAVVRGTWRDILEEAWYTTAPAPQQGVTRTRQDERQGVTPPQPDETTPLIFLEQHCNLDLDGDGYAEPYIVTLESTSRCVVRIVTRFDSEKAIERVQSGPRRGQIIKIRATEYFTKNTFIPSPDGGIYDIGFGVFLGPLNESVNSLVNMLLDSGTMQTTSGGFIARGVKIRGGVYTASPFEWKRVDSTGDDLRKGIVPLPANAPSDVLFQLLSLLINYAQRVAGTSDITVGENPGQNTPAQTTQTMVEMGQKVYTAIFKRIWRATKDEFQKIYALNGLYLPVSQPQVGGATREDYLGNGHDIAPVADPNVVSDAQALQQALTLKTASASTPGYDHDEVERRFLTALKVSAPDKVFKGTANTPPPKDVKLQIAELKEQGSLQRQQMALQAAREEFVLMLMEERRVNNAKILELMGKADEAAANAQSEQAYAQVAVINAEISRARDRNAALNTRIDQLLQVARLQLDHKLGMQAAAEEISE